MVTNRALSVFIHTGLLFKTTFTFQIFFMKSSLKALMGAIGIAMTVIACDFFSNDNAKPLPSLTGHWKVDSILTDTSAKGSVFQVLLFALALKDADTMYMQFNDNGVAYFKAGNQPDTLRYQRVNDSTLFVMGSDTTKFAYHFASNDTLLLTAQDSSAIGFRMIRQQSILTNTDK